MRRSLKSGLISILATGLAIGGTFGISQFKNDSQKFDKPTEQKAENFWNTLDGKKTKEDEKLKQEVENIKNSAQIVYLSRKRDHSDLPTVYFTTDELAIYESYLHMTFNVQDKSIESRARLSLKTNTKGIEVKPLKIYLVTSEPICIDEVDNQLFYNPKSITNKKEIEGIKQIIDRETNAKRPVSTKNPSVYEMYDGSIESLNDISILKMPIDEQFTFRYGSKPPCKEINGAIIGKFSFTNRQSGKTEVIILCGQDRIAPIYVPELNGFWKIQSQNKFFDLNNGKIYKTSTMHIYDNRKEAEYENFENSAELIKNEILLNSQGTHKLRFCTRSGKTDITYEQNGITEKLRKISEEEARGL